jgi:hypothetical protein
VWTSVIAAAALVATVVALALTSHGRGDGTGRFDASIAAPDRVLAFDVHLERGDVLDVQIAPDTTLDVAFAYAVDGQTAAEDYERLSPGASTLDEYLAELRALDGLFDDVAARHGWYVLYSTDRQGTGGPERDLLLAGADGTYRVLLRGEAGTTGHAVVDLRRARRQDLLDDRARFEQLVLGSRLSFDWYRARFG